MAHLLVDNRNRYITITAVLVCATLAVLLYWLYRDLPEEQRAALGKGRFFAPVVTVEVANEAGVAFRSAQLKVDGARTGRFSRTGRLVYFMRPVPNIQPPVPLKPHERLKFRTLTVANEGRVRLAVVTENGQTVSWTRPFTGSAHCAMVVLPGPYLKDDGQPCR